MNRQLRKIHAVSALLLSLGPWAVPGALAAVDCTQSVIQTISPPNTTIVSATAQSDPVPYCDVFGYVTTIHPGPNQVNFELSLPAEGNERFLFIGNGGFGGGFGFPEVYPDFENLTLLTKAGFAIAFHGVGSHGDDVHGRFPIKRCGSFLLELPDTLRRLIAIKLRHLAIHQDDVVANVL